MDEMDRQEWIVRCTERLVKLRPDIELRHLFHVAQSLWLDDRASKPEDAAEREACAWMGPPTEAGQL